MSTPYQVPTPSAPPRKRHAGLAMALVFVGALVLFGAAAILVLPKVLHSPAGASQPAANSTTAPSTTTPGKPAATSAVTRTSKSAKAGNSLKRGNVGQGSSAGYGQPASDAPPAVDRQELDRLTHQYNLLESRMAAFDESMNTMRQAQEQQGVGMRGDMAAAQNRLHGNMERMQSALAQKDLASAKRYLELCDRDAATLADFLGQ